MGFTAHRRYRQYKYDAAAFYEIGRYLLLFFHAQPLVFPHAQTFAANSSCPSIVLGSC